MEIILDYLNEFQLWGNGGWDYAQATLVFIGLMTAFKIFKLIILAYLFKLSQKTDNDVDDFAIRMVEELKPPFYLIIAFYIAIRPLNLNELVGKIVLGLFIIVLVFQAILIAQKVVDYILEKKILKDIEDAEDAQNKRAVIRLLSKIFKIILWLIGALMILSNLGVDVSSLIAGLGVGGIAVAFALQGVLGDLFASFSIFIDQPFKVGDYVQAGTESGTVKKVGMKTSRIKTLNGEELVVVNTDIGSSRVHNFSRMEKRRVKYDIGVIYGTSSNKLKEIPKIIKKIVDKEKDVSFGRVRFTTFGESSLIFEVLYHINKSDFDLYLEIQEKINLAIYEEFEKNKIEFAFPTQTVHVNKG
jgi:small-conductance mechanosensitive channel